MRLIDLSHVIESGISLFSESVPQPDITPWLSHKQTAHSGIYEGCSVEITEMYLVTSIGTYIDSPFHFNPLGTAIDGLKLDQLVMSGVVVDCGKISARGKIEPDVLGDIDVAGKAVLFKTGWDRFWKESDYSVHPYLTGATADVLRERGAKLVGVDFLVIDDTHNPRRPVHNTLLKNSILIVENLCNLDQLPPDNFIFHAAPVKVKCAAAFPVRAYAVVNEPA